MLGVALFALSPPVARAVETPFFQEPVAILLILALSSESRRARDGGRWLFCPLS
jgi:hypothetical protein